MSVINKETSIKANGSPTRTRRGSVFDQGLKLFATWNQPEEDEKNEQHSDHYVDDENHGKKYAALDIASPAADFHCRDGGRTLLADYICVKILKLDTVLSSVQRRLLCGQSVSTLTIKEDITRKCWFSYRVEHIIRWPDGHYVVRALLEQFKHQPSILNSSSTSKSTASACVLFPTSTIEEAPISQLLITFLMDKYGEVIVDSEYFKEWKSLPSTVRTKPNFKLSSLVYFIHTTKMKELNSLFSNQQQSQQQQNLNIKALKNFADITAFTANFIQKLPLSIEQMNSFRDTYMTSLKMVDCGRVSLRPDKGDSKVMNQIVAALQKKIEEKDYNGRSFLLSTVELGTFLYALEYISCYADGSIIFTLSMGRYDDGVPELDYRGKPVGNSAMQRRKQQMAEMNLRSVHPLNPPTRVELFLKLIFASADASFGLSASDFNIDPAPNHYAMHLSPLDAKFCKWDYEPSDLPQQSMYRFKLEVVVFTNSSESDMQINIKTDTECHGGYNICLPMKAKLCLHADLFDPSCSLRFTSVEALTMYMDILNIDDATKVKLVELFQVSPFVDFDMANIPRTMLSAEAKAIHVIDNIADANEPLLVIGWGNNQYETIAITIETMLTRKRLLTYFVDLNKDRNILISHITSCRFNVQEDSDPNSLVLILGLRNINKAEVNVAYFQVKDVFQPRCIALTLSELPRTVFSSDRFTCLHVVRNLIYAALDRSDLCILHLQHDDVCNTSSSLPCVRPLDSSLSATSGTNLNCQRIRYVGLTDDETEFFAVHQDSSINYWKATVRSSRISWVSFCFPTEHIGDVTCLTYAVLKFSDGCDDINHLERYAKDLFEKWDHFVCHKLYRCGKSESSSNHKKVHSAYDVSLVVTGGADHDVIVWDVSTPTKPAVVNILRGHNDAIVDLKVNSKLGIIISAGRDKVINMWDLFTGSLTQSYTHGFSITMFELGHLMKQNGNYGYVITAPTKKGVVCWNCLPNHRNDERCSTGIIAMKRYKDSNFVLALTTTRRLILLNESVLVASADINRMNDYASSLRKIKADEVVNIEFFDFAYNIQQSTVFTLSNQTFVVADHPFFELQSENVIKESDQKSRSLQTFNLINIQRAQCLAIAEVPDISSGSYCHYYFFGGIPTNGEYAGCEIWKRSIMNDSSKMERLEAKNSSNALYSRLKGCEVYSISTFTNFEYKPLVVIGGSSGAITVWKIQEFEFLYSLRGCSGPCLSINLLSRSSSLYVFATGKDNKILMWNFGLQHSNAMSLSSNHNLIQSIHKMDYLPYVFEHDQGIVVSQIDSMCIRDYRNELVPMLLAITSDNLIVAWNVLTKRIIHISASHTNRINALLIYKPLNASYSYLISATDDGCTIWKDGLHTFRHPPSKHLILRAFYSDISLQSDWRQMRQLLSCYPNVFRELPQLFYLALIEREETFFVEFIQELIDVIVLIPEYKRATSDVDVTRWIHHRPRESDDVDILEYAMHTRALIALRGILLAWSEALNKDIHDCLNQKALLATRKFNEKNLLELAVFFPVEYTEFMKSLNLIRCHRSVESVDHNLFRVIPNGKRIAVLGSNLFQHHKVDDYYRPIISHDDKTLTVVQYWRKSIKNFKLRLYDALMTFKVRIIRGDDNDKQAVMPFMLPIKRFVDVRQLFVAVRSSDILGRLDVFESDIMVTAITHYWQTYGWKVYWLNLIQYFYTIATFVISIYLYERAISCSAPNKDLLRRTQLATIGFLFFMSWFGIDEVCRVIGKFWKLYKNNHTAVRLLHIFLSHFLFDLWNVIDGCLAFTGLYGGYLRLVELNECYSQGSYVTFMKFDSSNVNAITVTQCYPYEGFGSWSSCLLATTAALLWFKVLYYMRPIKVAGQFVVMVMVIMSDIKYFLFVLLCVLIGFAQGFWLLLNQSSIDSSFKDVKDSYFTTFMFMFGQMDMDDLQHSKSDGFTKVFLVAFMLAMMILLFNLLIALMGDSFSKTKENINAHYMRELASFMVDQSLLTPLLVFLRLFGIARYNKDEFVHVIKYASDVKSKRISASQLTTSGFDDDGDDDDDDDDSETTEKKKKVRMNRDAFNSRDSESGSDTDSSCELDSDSELDRSPRRTKHIHKKYRRLITSRSSKLLRKSFTVCMKIVRSTTSSHHHFRTTNKASIHTDIIRRISNHVAKKNEGTWWQSIKQTFTDNWNLCAFKTDIDKGNQISTGSLSSPLPLPPPPSQVSFMTPDSFQQPLVDENVIDDSNATDKPEEEKEEHSVSGNVSLEDGADPMPDVDMNFGDVYYVGKQNSTIINTNMLYGFTSDEPDSRDVL